MIRALAKSILPIALLQRLREQNLLRRRRDQWIRARQSLATQRTSERPAFSSMLLIPSDPWLIVGSRGDDAMVTTVVSEARKRVGDCKIGVASVFPDLPPVVKEMGAVAEPLWLGADYGAFLACMDRYDTVMAIGADVMDGHFSVADAFRAWSFLDLAARRGKRAAAVGFSFSHTPSGALAEIIGELSPELFIYARDRVSKEKFDASAATPAVLVADCAFLLPASPTAPDHARAAEWATAQRASGRFICTFNTHPMIFHDCDPQKVAHLNALLADIFTELAERYPVSFLLVPHDFRDETRGDNASLAPLHAQLSPRLADRIFFAPSPCRASELKALASIGDLLITGRMHLGVGALSLGMPMWAINPQDKFIGLFEHFGLPDQRLDPEAALNRETLLRFIKQAFVTWPDVRDRVRAALPDVRERAATNFAPLDM